MLQVYAGSVKDLISQKYKWLLILGLVPIMSLSCSVFYAQYAVRSALQKFESSKKCPQSPYVSFSPTDRARSFSPPYTPLRNLITGYDEVVTSSRSITSFTFQLFLSQIREIFVLSWPRFPKASQPLPKISDHFPKTSERCWKCPKVFRRPLNQLISFNFEEHTVHWS